METEYLLLARRVHGEAVAAADREYQVAQGRVATAHRVPPETAVAFSAEHGMVKISWEEPDRVYAGAIPETDAEAE